jgi:hypothetical protein
MNMKTVEYKAKGYNGEKVAVPAKYVKKAKYFVNDLLKLKNEEGLGKLLEKHGYAARINEQEILHGVRELLEYNKSYNPSDGQSKQKLRELKDNIYLRVCLNGADKITNKKVRKIKKKSEEEIRKADREHQRIKERIEKILRDD